MMGQIIEFDKAAKKVRQKKVDGEADRLERMARATKREAFRADHANKRQPVAARKDQMGIDVVSNACKVNQGEIECVYCQQIISAKSFQRTCPVCASKWVVEAAVQQRLFDAGAELDRGWTANAVGKVIWYDQEFHQDGLLREYHNDMRVDANNPKTKDEKQPLWFSQIVCSVEEMTIDDLSEVVPVVLHNIDPENIELALICKAIDEQMDLSTRKIVEMIKVINGKRIKKGNKELPVPSHTAVANWLKIFRENENAHLRNERFLEAA